MASSTETDTATEALIAKMMAEDLGEAYSDQMRPIGSWYGDYEDPLTGWERRCIEQPGIENSDDTWGWGPTPETPKIEPVEEPTLPEGEWNSACNDDPSIDWSASTTRAVEEVVTRDDNTECEQEIEGKTPEDGAHVNTHVDDPSKQPRAPSPSTLETTTTPPPQFETNNSNNQTPPPQTTPPMQQPPTANTTSPKSIHLILPPFQSSNPFAPSIRTNEALLNLTSPDLYLDSDIDMDSSSASTPKTKAKAKGKERADMSLPYRTALTTTSRSKTHTRYLRRTKHNDNTSTDSTTGLPLLRVPWPGTTALEREMRDLLDSHVVEIRVGEEETVDSILSDIAEREDGGRREWGEGKDKGKGKAVDCW